VTKIGSLLALLTISAATLFADVQAYVDAEHIQSGDNVRFTIETDQENTVFPEITTIGDYPVLASPTSRSIQSINGRHSASIKKSYVFQPIKNMTIPAYTLQVNGATVRTKPIAITVAKRSQTLDKPYRFDIAVDNKTPYVGQEISLEATFSINENMSLEGLDLFLERLNGFVVDSSDANWRGSRVGDRIVYKRTFRLYPQKSGAVTIDHQPIVGLVSDGRVRMFFGESQKISAYSNTLKLDVKPLPAGVSLVGDYTLKMLTDTFKTKAGEPVNLTLSLAGEGSLEGFSSFEVNIPGVTAFGDKPTTSGKRENGKLLSSATYHFALVSDRSYTIPPFVLRFLNPKTGKVKELKTAPVSIEVEGAPEQAKNDKVTIERPEDNNASAHSSGGFGWPYLLVTLVVGVLIGLVLPRPTRTFRTSRQAATQAAPLALRIKKCKDGRGMLALLLPYVDRPEIRAVVDELERGMDAARFKEIKQSMQDYFKGV